MAGNSLKILSVEDHSDSAEVLAMLLVGHDYSVVTVRDFRAALDAAKKEPFDLLLCDIGLPDGDGCDLLRELKSMYPMKAIAVSAYGMPGDVERYRVAGFADFVLKPYKLEQLLSAIQRVFLPATTDAAR